MSSEGQIGNLCEDLMQMNEEKAMKKGKMNSD
jgi:hypothetical protein